MPRVLVLTASVGEGHDLPARVLADGLQARDGSAEVEIVDALKLVGGPLRRVAEDSMRETFGAGRMHWLFDAQYLLFSRTPPLRVLGQAALHRVTGGRLLAELERRSPDVVVSTYPASTDVLGWLRRTGRLRVPAVAAITDLAGLRYWAAPGIDLHLVTHPESIAEVERIAGPGRIVAVRGLHDERFLTPPEPTDARRAVGLSAEGPVVAVSGGGWGVGDVHGAVRVARERAQVLALCGRNERLRAALEADGVLALPFVEDVATPLAAADVLVHSTAGLTVLEALLVGCRPISYGWGVGHIRVNNRAFTRTGLAQVARDEAGLRAAIDRALVRPRDPHAPRHAALPHAADLVLELVQAASR